MNILVSACLLGVGCRYDGASKPCEKVVALGKEHHLIPVCPEILGGLPTPRPPAEIRGDRVCTEDGQDVTAQYRKGAEEVLGIARVCGAELAVLKSRSPSCGSGQIHNGHFDGGMCQGWGVAASLLRQSGIRVIDENAL